MLKRPWLTALGTAVALVTSAVPATASFAAAQPQRSAPVPQAAAPGASARAPLSCAGDILLSAGTPTTQLYEGVTGPGEITFMPVGTASQDYNAIGVNPDDNYIYAIQRGATPNLLRIDDAGAATIIGTTGLPAGAGNYAAGAFDDAGNFFVTNGYNDQLYRVDVTAKTATLITLSETLGGVIDFAYSNGYLWGANRQGGISRIDPTTGTVTTYASILPVADYGGTYTYGNGDLGFFSNSGTITRLQIATPDAPTFTQLSTQQAPASSVSVDATSCFQMPVDLAVTKEGPATVSAGGEISYTIRLTNNGPNPSSGWTVTDDIPAGLENAATTTDGCSITNGMLSCTGGALAVDDSVEITLTGTAAVGATSIENTAKVFGNDPDPDPDNNEDTTTTTVAPSVDLGVTKEGPATATAGEDVSYTITVTNNGPSNSTGWTVTDEIPATLRNAASTTPGCSVTGQTLTCEGGPLAVGDSATITLTGTAAANATRIVNPATVEGNEPDPNPDNNEDTVTTTLERRVDLAVTKTGPATVAAGGEVSYTITVTNNGPSDSTGWGLNDPIPAGLENAATTTPDCSIGADGLTCIGGPLAVGDSEEITLTGTAAPGATSIVNTAVVDGNDPDPDPGNNEDTTTTTVTPSVDLAVTKTGPATVAAGGEVSYTITVTNNGPSNSTGWTVTDLIPAGLADAATTTPGCAISGRTLTCEGGALAVGDSATITLTGTAAVGASRLLNTVVVEGNEPDPDPDNNEDDTTTTVNPSVDLAVTKTGPATVSAGGDVSYTITVTNNGPSNSTGWTLTDEIPAGLADAATSTAGCAIADRTLTCEGGPLAVGDSREITLTGTAAANATRIVNTAVVDGNEPDPNPDNDEDTTTTTVNPSVDLAVAKVGPAEVAAGGRVLYRITVTNNGPSDSTGWTLTDTIPLALQDPATPTDGCAISGRTLTCTGGALAVGDSTSVVLTATAPSETVTFVNTAVVEGNEPDPDPDNNEDTVTTEVPPVVNAEVDLTLAKEGPATVKEGEEISYTITVTNNGPGDSSGWTLTDTVPAGLADAATSTDGCSITGRTLTCEGGPLADGESADVVLTGTAAEGVTRIVNTAVVEGNEPDPDPDNNDDTTTTEVTGEPGLTIEKKQNGPATVQPGDTVEYTITVTNTGDTAYTAADPATFTDDLTELLDDAAYNDDAEASRGTVSYDEPTLSWRGALEPGQSATITFSVTTDVRTFGDLKLHNTVVSTTPGNNCARGSEDERCTTDGKVTPKDKK
ncbi:DUF6923 family protein [Streptomyces sp. NPDC017979]|uniref:DUF6923 family protein n=1 Tax=Streptomyces sp. NPDC017979 TaxID=3365024 RepID=UPI0037B98B5E